MTTASRAETPVVSPERAAQIETAIARVQAQGLPVSNEAVYTMVRGSRTSFTTYMKAWRRRREGDAMAQAPASAPPVETSAPALRSRFAEANAPVPDSHVNGSVPPVPAAPPPRLIALDTERRDLQRAREELNRRMEVNAEAIHGAKGQAQAILARLRRSGWLARQAPWHEQQAAMQPVLAAQQDLAWYVGAEEASRAKRDLTYTPRGLS
jgi:hypothetical protein